jgi:hypothetical protein
MWHRQQLARVALQCGRVLVIAAAIVFLLLYFGSHVRDAGGMMASTPFNLA